MKTYRRIELTMFRRRVTIISGKQPADTQEIKDICINNVDSQESITLESAEGQRILIETLHLLEEKIFDQPR